ncbi:MAG: hypothetical protein MR868_03910 [Lachnospiraceae bacterium]|nr:hypothetical protein [Lachnospiraceae bacterium]
MKRNATGFLLALLMLLSLCVLCTACGDAEIPESAKHTESSTISPQDDPNEGLGGDLPVRNEDIVDETGLYEGLWLSEVTDQYDYLEIDADGNWQLFSDGYVLDEGYLWYDPEWDTTFVYSTLDGFMDGGCIELEGDQIYIDICGYFDYPDGRNGQWQGAGGSNWDGEYREDSAESIGSREPYFTRYGFEINAAVDAGTYWIEDGVCSYAAGDQFHTLGDNYTLGDCDWEVIKNYDSTRNGIREIQFDAICYVPYSSVDDFGGALKCSVYHQLYDFYTGKWFTRIDDYKTSSRGKDYYVHTVEWNGQSGIIEFTRSSDWQSDVGEWARVVTVSYHVYLPEWYDGLVLATEPLPDNYEDFARFDSQHSAFAEASIMDIDLLDSYGCLFFSVCN